MNRMMGPGALALALLSVLAWPVSAQTFSNNTPLTVSDTGANNGVPYPSTLTVSGLTGVIGKLTVQLKNITHTFPDDLDILLVGPNGTYSMIMSDAGGSGDITNLTLTFDQYASTVIPNGGTNAAPLLAGTYRPANYTGQDGENDPFAAPAPAAPYLADLRLFDNSSPNGEWKLYVRDDTNLDSGLIAGGWSLDFTTIPVHTVSGTISLEDCTSVTLPVRFEFRPTDGSAIFTRTVTPAEDGSYTLPNIPARAYQVAIKTLRNLQQVIEADVTAGNVTDASVFLPGGDANDDNSADALDLAVLIDAFNSTPGDVVWNPDADFNCDDSDDAFDLAILIGNFNTDGDS